MAIHNNPGRCTGLTLVELLVTIAVALVLATVGVPAFTVLVDRNQLTTEVNAVSGQLQLARSEALKRSADVTFCITHESAGNRVCDPNPEVWGATQEMTVWNDADSDGVVDAGERLGQMQRSSRVVVAVSSGPATVQFNSRGIALGALSVFNVSVSGDAGEARCLTVLPSGSVNLQGAACGG